MMWRSAAPAPPTMTGPDVSVVVVNIQAIAPGQVRS
jgi:hypothetical protein